MSIGTLILSVILDSFEDHGDVNKWTLTPEDVRSAVMGYLRTELWTATESDEDGNARELDEVYAVEDFSGESAIRAAQDVTEFILAAGEADVVAYVTSADVRVPDGDPWGTLGHDFSLTRSGHGEGFWSRNLPGGLGARLTAHCGPYGETYVYVGDDGQLHLA